jgi:predicted  nucleic acid-binding Zn-ribbon protein
MADNNDILKAIESIQSDVTNIKKDIVTKNDLQEVKQAQAQTNTSLGQITTAVEALAAGQKEQATKGDIHRLEQKIDKVEKNVKSHTSRIENLEENTGIPNPHKN